MSPRSENPNELPRVRDGRRRELRELLVSAAHAARRTRESAMDTAHNRTVDGPVRERMSILLAATR